MELKDIAAVSGKGGLFKVLKPTRTGVILETLDDSKKKVIVGANARVSLLREISIYTTSAESSVMLETVFDSIRAKFGPKLEVSSKDDGATLESFLGEVVPDFDSERVYLSDIKKLVTWYSIVSDFAPELFEVKEEKKEVKKKAAPAKKKVEAKEGDEKKPAVKKKPAAKKAPAKKKDA